MAQKGGTWRPGVDDVEQAEPDSLMQSPREVQMKDKDPAVYPNAEARIPPSQPAFSTPAQRRELGNAEKDWVVVRDPNDEAEKAQKHASISSQFNLSVGWGRWKYPLFGWDLTANVRTEPPSKEEEK